MPLIDPECPIDIPVVSAPVVELLWLVVIPGMALVDEVVELLLDRLIENHPRRAKATAIAAPISAERLVIS
jgi:hypothetical protein